jgi:hypothetical protein
VEFTHNLNLKSITRILKTLGLDIEVLSPGSGLFELLMVAGKILDFGVQVHGILSSKFGLAYMYP